ncbi:MAG TPA: efflux RND transporter periplasmic adaptor subunit [Syntrophales bacterium]|nr:efflux RND transporter periplasmic adaptor subunit [Geobacteraceae bacterium]HPQ45283.1 efflux RND transporter periplasmic adaptor subunit [Syntrophales bacterium]
MKEKSEAGSDITTTLGIDKASKKGKRLKKWLAWIMALLIVGVALAFLATRNKTEPLQFRTQVAERGDLTIIVTATGNLEPTNQVDVGSELSGIIKTVEADYNDHVKVGQILARLDTTKLEAEVRKSKASLESAKAQVLQAQATVKEKRLNLERMEKVRLLSGGKVPSQQDMDTAEAEFERARADESSAKAQVSQAQATLESDETNLTKTVIRSPINGIVLVRDVEPGQTVAASLQAPVLFTLAEDLTKMELHVDIDEADVGEVQDGLEATFTVDAYPGRSFPAQIAQVRYGAEETDGVVTYKAVLTVKNSDLFLRPGMTATADITVKRIDNAILVPNAALRFTPPIDTAAMAEKQSGNGSIVSKILPRPPQRRKNSQNNGSVTVNKSQQRVWMVHNGTAVPVVVTTGATDGVRTEIRGGDLQAGTPLIVAVMSVEK